jgi:hypothetical protein
VHNHSPVIIPRGEIKYLSAGEIDQIVARLNDYTLNRAWENWARRAGRQMGELADSCTYAG